EVAPLPGTRATDRVEMLGTMNQSDRVAGVTGVPRPSRAVLLFTGKPYVVPGEPLPDRGIAAARLVSHPGYSSPRRAASPVPRPSLLHGHGVAHQPRGTVR